jgi:hypothetical protein
MDFKKIPKPPEKNKSDSPPPVPFSEVSQGIEFVKSTNQYGNTILYLPDNINIIPLHEYIYSNYYFDFISVRTHLFNTW